MMLKIRLTIRQLMITAEPDGVFDAEGGRDSWVIKEFRRNDLNEQRHRPEVTLGIDQWIVLIPTNKI